MKCTAMAALVFAACLAWGPATGAAPAEKPEKALTGTATAAAVDAGGKAGTVPSAQKDADKAIKAVAPQSDDKTGKADKSDKDGKENKDSKKETAHVPTDDDCVLLDSLDTLTIPPLQASDFYIGSIHHGDRPAKVKRIFGPPAKFSRSTHYTTMQYNDKDLKMRFTFRNKTADSLRHSADTRKAVLPGAESMFLSAGTNILIGRDVRLKYPAEVLLRQYGLPDSVLRDADANVYYFTYESPRKDVMYVFAIGNCRIERVALMPVRPPYITGDEPADRMKLGERDFTLMGFGLNQPFEPNKYNMWTNLVKRNNSNFWLYGDYGVEVDRRNIVQKVFLLTNNAYTGRGATLGYHVSTILALYGRPDRVEWGPDKEKSVDAYYYDSPYQKGVSLVIVVRHNEPYVDDIILTSTPIKNIQDPMERYGLK